MVRGKKLRDKREAAGLTRKQLGEIVACGHQTLYRYETGKVKRPDLVLVRRLEMHFQLPKGDLVD